MLNWTHLGHEVTLKVLIDAGSDIEVKNSHEETALDYAVLYGQLGSVKVLLQNGAVIESREDARYVLHPQQFCFLLVKELWNGVSNLAYVAL